MKNEGVKFNKKTTLANIPKVMKIKNLDLKSRKKLFSKDFNNRENNKDKFNNTYKTKLSKISLLYPNERIVTEPDIGNKQKIPYSVTDDNYSIGAKTCINDKVLKVTFSTIEIIRVENYKKYNKIEKDNSNKIKNKNKNKIKTIKNNGKDSGLNKGDENYCEIF